MKERRRRQVMLIRILMMYLEKGVVNGGILWGSLWGQSMGVVNRGYPSAVPPLPPNLLRLLNIHST